MNSLKLNCFFLIFLVATSCHNNELINKSEVVACVNNEPISTLEFKYWMLLEKANVYNYFYHKYQMSDSDNFWTQHLGNEIPLEKLKEVALMKAKRCKVQLTLARDKGIVETVDFDEIMGGLEEVNAQRREKVERGEPIYGPLQFSKRTYFSDLFDKTMIELKNALAKSELKPDDIIMQELHPRANRNLEFLIMQYVDENYEKYIDQLTNKAEISINHEIYQNIELD